MKILKYYFAALMSVLTFTSCYEDFTDDYSETRAYFSSQQPLRTVIADRDMNIKVGVAIGGKREVDTKDWAEFSIEPELLEGTGLTLLPESFYKLSNENRFSVSKPTLAVADVQIDFTEEFYNDANAANTYYALPFKVTSISLDGILEGKDYSIVAIKYLSKYHGTYYVKGKMTTTENGEEKITNYSEVDLSKNITRNLSTLNRNSLFKQGLGNRPIGNGSEKLKLTFYDDNTVSVESGDSNVPVTNAQGTYTYNDKTFEMTINLSYTFTVGGQEYKVEETLIRRQDPLKDLRFEEWS